MSGSRKAVYAFVLGLIVGLLAYRGALEITGHTPVSREFLDEQQAQLNLLQEENLELTEELLRPSVRGQTDFDPDDLPYDGEADAGPTVQAARRQAQAEGKFLMVTFGANWCLDCRTLHRHLTSEPIAAYTRDVFSFVNVDVGKFNQNHDVAESLGVSLRRGIPVAIFFDPDGNVIGTTNDGELEPARHYSSKQILKFVRDIAERQQIHAPDSIN